MWRDEYSISPDNLTSSWLPDTYHVYGDKLEELGMCDTRTIMHEQRFFFSNNDLDPKIYQVTKITDLNPQGIIKLSIKQDELNEKRDNIELHICDYYTDEGDILIDKLSNDTVDVSKTSTINWMNINENGELDYTTASTLQIGKTYYFEVKFSDVGIDPQWRIELVDINNEFTPEEHSYYIGLMKLTKFDKSTLAIKTAKASSLKGKKFDLYVSDIEGNYKSAPIRLEVSE